jgi:hypothetical protein
MPFPRKLGPLRLLFLSLSALLLAANLSSAATVRSSKPSAADLQDQPLGGKAPVLIHIGLYVAELPMVNEPSEDFELQGYLYASWHDDRLVSRDNRQAGKTHQLDPAAVWNPELDMVNARTFRSFRHSFLAYPDGTVLWEERFDAVLSNQYFLRGFPFDMQLLEIKVQPVTSPERPQEALIEFADEDYATGINPDAYLAAWEIDHLAYALRSAPIGDAGAVVPQARFEILVKRRSGFYVWKVFLPIFLMVLVPWSVFWVSTKEFDWQMKIPIAIMLAMVAFEYSISWDLPRISYITFLDAVFLTSFAFTFLTTVEITAVHVLIMREMLPVAEKIQRSSRWLFPLAYLLVLLLLVLLFFGGRGRPQ